MNLANFTPGSHWVTEERMGVNADQDEMKHKTLNPFRHILFIHYPD
jgi:hypothetical protein